MEDLIPHVFQTDSEEVNEIYNKEVNYFIDYNYKVNKEYCIIYFSSNNIYYPNNYETFRNEIIVKDKYEWFGTRVNCGYKHIFIRDIMKQWYLSGINSEIDSPNKLLNFLKIETKGFKVITVGSSAGGFMAVIMGQLLDACKIYSFNGQFEIESLLSKSNESIDPLVFRLSKSAERRKYYISTNFIKKPETIFYFTSTKSSWDKEQSEFISHLKINFFYFKTSNHGIPFLKTNLPYILNFSSAQLKSLSNHCYHPIPFSIKIAGLKNTIDGLSLIAKVLFKRYNIFK